MVKGFKRLSQLIAFLLFLKYNLFGVFFLFFFFSQGIHSCWKAGFPSIRTSVWLWKYESPESGSSLLQLEQPLCCWKPGGQVLPMASRIPSWPRRQWLGKRKAERTGKDGTSTALSHGWNPGMASLSTCPLSRTQSRAASSRTLLLPFTLISKLRQLHPVPSDLPVMTFLKLFSSLICFIYT